MATTICNNDELYHDLLDQMDMEGVSEGNLNNLHSIKLI